MSTPFTYLAAAVGMAIAIRFSAPFVMGGRLLTLTPASTITFGAYKAIRRSRRRNAQKIGFPPWQLSRPSSILRIPPAEVVQRLVAAGVKPNDAVVEAQCVLATAA